MKSKIQLPKVFIILIASAALLTACSVASAAPLETETAVIDAPSEISQLSIVAESRVVPQETVDLSFEISGEVAEVLVSEGDQVKAGDLLARLGNQETLLSTIAAAELELFNAQQALDELYDNLETTRAGALQAIAAANRAVRDSQYQLDNYTIPSNQEDLTATEAVVVMRDELDKAREAFEPYKNKASGDETRKDYKENLDNAQSDYNSAVRRLEYEVELVDAEAQLEKATQDYEALQAGPNPDDIEGAEVSIAAAQAALESAQASLDNLELRATIDGTIVSLDLITGEQVSPGQKIIQIADFSQWYVETDDLTEIDVVDVNIGQKVSIVADALPGLEMSGTVSSISQVYEEKRGDVTYTVEIQVDEADPNLRWGMTVAVTFDN